MPKIYDKSYTVTASGLFAGGGTTENRFPVSETIQTALTPPFTAVPVPSGIYRDGKQAFGVYIASGSTRITTIGCFGVGDANACGYWGSQTFNVSWVENNVNPRCSNDSCRVDCVGQPDGFCCIDHSVTNTLLTILQG